MNSYFLCITQPTNLGDLVINKMLVMELSKYGQVYVDCKNTPRRFADFLVEGDNIVDVEKAFGVSIKSGHIVKWYKHLKSNDIKLYVPSPGPIGSGISNARSYYLKLVSFILKRAGISEYKIGNCCSGALAEGRKFRFPRIKMAYIRSRSSVSVLKEQGVENVSYIPDLAFLLRQHVELTEKQQTVILSFRQVTNGIDDFKDTLISYVNHLIDRGFHVEFYYQVLSDKSFNESLANLFSSPNVTFRKEMVWYESLNYYSDKMIVVSNRLHSLLIGAVYNVVPLALVNNDSKVSKIEDVFRSSLTNPDTYIAHNGDVDKIIDIVTRYNDILGAMFADISKNCSDCVNTIRGICAI